MFPAIIRYAHGYSVEFIPVLTFVSNSVPEYPIDHFGIDVVLKFLG